jgi:hypothetical protein
MTDITNLASLNHDNDTVVISRGPVGRIYGANAEHPDFDLAFITTSCGTVSYGEVSSFNYITGEVIHLFYFPDIGGTKQGSAYGSGLYSDEANKRVFFGGNLGGLYAWDPTVDPAVAYQDYGLLDANVGVISSLQVTTTHAYVAGSGNFLAICNLSTGAVTKVWEGSATSVQVYRDYYDATHVYIKTIIGGVTNWWSIDNADPLVPVDLSTIVDPGTRGLNSRGIPSTTGYSYETTSLYPGPDKAITFRYKRTGDTNFRTIDAVLLDVVDYNIQRIFVDGESNIVCCPQGYGALSKYTPTTSVKSRIGNISTLSPYGFGVDRYRNLEWFSGYPDQTWQRDPASSVWDLTTNPISLAGMPHYGGKSRCSLVVRANDGLIWFGTSLENPPIGCQIFWYNPDTLEYGEIDRSIMAASDSVYYHYPKFCMNLSATKLVMSALHVDTATKGLVAVVYLPRKTVRYLYPLGDVLDQGVLVSVERSKATANHFVGITNSVGGVYKAYCIDIRTGAFVWGPITGISGVTSFPYLNGGQPIFRHGYVWYYVGNTIVKMDPADGSLVGTPYDLVANGTVAGNMVWGDDGEFLYHFGLNLPSLFSVPKADLGV